MSRLGRPLTDVNHDRTALGPGGTATPAVPEAATAGPDHLAYLLHAATRRLRSEGEAAGRAGGPDRRGEEPLQAAQARLLDLIPDDGGRLTDLAAAMRISKQGLGQLAVQLAQGGYVELGPDPADRRARRVVRTPLGDRRQRLMRAVIGEVEQRWSEQVGPERYAVFLEVLRELVAPGE
jgi:DNA-binding MarR family transcriptional regulator